MNWFRITTAYLTVVLATTTTGCSLLNLGEEDFACPGKSKGVSCASTREMYQATNNGSIPRPVTKKRSR